ncbi:phosphotransferase enzyme family protein [Thermomonas fusca]|uniref:Aminoglycoside phosphotransferase family protein n=1 Tax=Thermomonas fusca TaxID=215690 RepID=A0A5R9PEN8_9GAMM|nr:phosphotransferase [Thermomonas fusca]TLX21527.1 aminoglycoside phosphotransferase family protein [Thermomonas fusca]
MTASNHPLHGWDSEQIALHRPQLEDADVHALLARFPGLRGPMQILWRSPRPFSAVARVGTAAGEVFVKRQHLRVRTPVALGEEHALLVHLRRRDIPVPQILADADGMTAIAMGEWVYEVQAPAAGLDLYRDTPSWTPLRQLAHARHAGRMLARLHRAAADFDATQRSATLLVARDDALRAPELHAAIESQWVWRPGLAAYLAGRGDWRDELAPLAARHRALQPHLDALPRLWTHGDWHASNLCWTGAGDNAEVAAVLDFGLCAPTFALYDLATAIERNAIAWLQLERGMQAIHPDTARALVAGYAEVLPLATAERALLADLLPLVHIDFALSEIDYYQAAFGARAQADQAWDGFLLGHAAWFQTPPGLALLTAIHEPE